MTLWPRTSRTNLSMRSVGTKDAPLGRGELLETFMPPTCNLPIWLVNPCHKGYSGRSTAPGLYGYVYRLGGRAALGGPLPTFLGADSISEGGARAGLTWTRPRTWIG